jgi:hypothetical protein
MPTNVTIIHTRDFIRATASGDLDLATSRNILTDLVAKVTTTGENHVLIDTRGAESQLTTTDLFELGVEVAMQPALAHSKVGLLVPLEKEFESRFFENVTRNRGAYLRAFTNFETAITWLIMEDRQP